MNLFLPKYKNIKIGIIYFLFLSIVPACAGRNCQLLVIPSPVYAQEATPTSSPSAQTSKAKNPLEDFINSLLGKDIPDTLEEINKASLPYGVGQGIKPVVDPKKEEPEEKEEELGIQENVKGESTVDTDPACKAATQYTVAEWARTPPTGEEERSINVANFFKKLFGDLLNFLGIRDTGNKEAKKFVSTDLPKDVPDKLLGQKPISAGGSAQVLGLISSEQDAMSFALPFKQCENLPPPLCIGLKLNYVIPYYKTNTEKSLIIDGVASRFLGNAQTIVSAFEKRWPTSLIGHWREVYDESAAQNWNPVFVLAVWIEETAASDVCSIEKRQGKDGIWDFGVVSLPKSYCSDDAAVRQQKFRKQLSVFISLVGKYKSWYGKSVIEFEEFMCRYSEGHYPCTFGTNPGFVKRLKPVYDCLVSESPSSDTCPSGYFAF